MDEAVDYDQSVSRGKRRESATWRWGGGIPREVFPTPWDPKTTIFASSVEGMWCVVVL